MRTIHERINDLRGNLITVTSKEAKLGELARIERKDGGPSTYASVLRFEGDQVTLQVFGGTRGISTGDRVIFLKRAMEATYGEALLGRRLSGGGIPIDGGPDIQGENIP